MKKLILLAAVGVGYVLGSRAGRERYEQLRSTVDKVRSDPRIQEKAHQAVDLAKEKAPVVKDKVAEAADAAAAKVRSTGTSAGSSTDRDDLYDRFNPESTALQQDSGPQGDLP